MGFSGTSNSLLLVLLSLTLKHYCLALGITNNNPYPFLTWDVSQIANREFDYIVVGGGAAGCPLAVTLSQNFSVLLVERGTSPFGVPDIERGDAFLKPLAYADNYTSIAQVFTSEDGVPSVRARVLGGGTALNAGFYSRGSRKMTSFDLGLEEYLVEQSYRWIESKLVHKPRSLTTWSSAMLEALLDAGVLPNNGFTFEHVVGTKYSGSIFDESGKRHVAAELLDYANANNIVVLLNSTVARVLFESGGTGVQPRSYGVEFQDRNRVSYTAKLKSGKHSEVILCAGALGSPQLMMLSGIGPAAHLKSLGIPVVVDSPVVGNGMADNPSTLVKLQSSTQLNWSPAQVVGITENSSTYIEGSSGYDNATKISSGTFVQKLAFPKSSGELRLKNLDPRENPVVRFNYYSHPDDVQTCISGVRTVSDMLKSPAIRRFGYPNVTTSSEDLRYIGNSLPENVSNLTAVEEYCLNSISTIYHFHGGCRIGSVVDAKNRVNGVEGLRVVDGSTFKDSPGTNPQATTMMLGRYKAIKILQERSSA